MLPKVAKALKSERGEANYISSVVYIFVAVILVAFILNLFSIISAKQQLDHAADQMVKQIQLSGGLNSDTDALFEFLTGKITSARDVAYAVETQYRSPRPAGMREGIQLGTPFYVTIRGQCHLGGFWKIDALSITIEARAAGVSEKYWK